jgi:hypothetical protein
VVRNLNPRLQPSSRPGDDGACCAQACSSATQSERHISRGPCQRYTGACPIMRSERKKKSVDFIYPTGIIVDVSVKRVKRNAKSVSSLLFSGVCIIERAPVYIRGARIECVQRFYQSKKIALGSFVPIYLTLYLSICLPTRVFYCEEPSLVLRK